MEITPELKEAIMHEVASQMRPVGAQMDALLSANEEQTVALGVIKEWMHKFYGNGSGRIGEWEKRRKEDDARYQKLFVSRNEMEIDKARKEERAAVLKEVASLNEDAGRRRRELLLIAATGGSVAVVELVKALIVYGQRLLHLLGL